MSTYSRALTLAASLIVLAAVAVGLGDLWLDRRATQLWPAAGLSA